MNTFSKRKRFFYWYVIDCESSVPLVKNPCGLVHLCMPVCTHAYLPVGAHSVCTLENIKVKNLF